MGYDVYDHIKEVFSNGPNPGNGQHCLCPAGHTHKHAHAPRTPPNHRRCARHVHDALAGGLDYLYSLKFTLYFLLAPTPMRVEACRSPWWGSDSSSGTSSSSSPTSSLAAFASA